MPTLNRSGGGGGHVGRAADIIDTDQAGGRVNVAVEHAVIQAVVLGEGSGNEDDPLRRTGVGKRDTDQAGHDVGVVDALIASVGADQDHPAVGTVEFVHTVGLVEPVALVPGSNEAALVDDGIGQNLRGAVFTEEAGDTVVNLDLLRALLVGRFAHDCLSSSGFGFFEKRYRTDRRSARSHLDWQQLDKVFCHSKK